MSSTRSGRTDDGTDTDGYYNSEFFVPLRNAKDWPAVVEQEGWRRWLYGPKRPRTKDELIKEMDDELERKLPGVNWNFSQNIRDNVMEALSGVKGDNSLKIIGPDFKGLQDLGSQAKNIMQNVPGLEDVGVFNVLGQSHLEFRPGPGKVPALGRAGGRREQRGGQRPGRPGRHADDRGRESDSTSAIRWPAELRESETSILDIPVDVGNNQVVQPQGPGFTPSATGTGQAPPAVGGSLANTANPLSNTPRLRLRDVVSPVGEDGAVDPDGQFEKPGAAVIYREGAKRLIAVKFSVRGRDLASAVAEARKKTQHLFQPPYSAVWSGEFEEMQDHHGPLDVDCSPFAGPDLCPPVFGLAVLAGCRGRAGQRAGGVDGRRLGLVPYRHHLQHLGGRRLHFALRRLHHGRAVVDLLLQPAPCAGSALWSGRSSRGPPSAVRPVMMTDLTALCGLLPAALSTQIGSQTQRPAGHRRGRRDGHDVAAHPVPCAGAVQLLRPSRTAGRFRQHGALTWIVLVY